MLAQSLLQNCAVDSPVLSVCAALAPRQTFLLRPRAAGVVHVTQGRLWLTLDGPHVGPANAWGDHVLYAGQSMTLRGGASALLEGWPVEAGSVSQWEWRPMLTLGDALTSRVRRGLMHSLRAIWRRVDCAPRPSFEASHGVARP